MYAQLLVTGAKVSDPSAVQFCAISSANLPLSQPEAAGRVLPYKVLSMTGVLSDSAGSSLQVRWHHYEYDDGQTCDEVWVGNSSIERALGYLEMNVTVKLTVSPGLGKPNIEHVRSLKAARFFDATGYWTVFGQHKYNPLPSSISLMPAVNSDTYTSALASLAQWKPVGTWPASDIANQVVDETGFSPVTDSPLAYALAPYTGTTGSPLAVGIIPREVAAQAARFTPEQQDDTAAETQLKSLVEYCRQQARRPYHYWSDSGIPYNVQNHSSAIIGSLGFQKGLYSHMNAYGRDAMTPPPADRKNPFNAFDKHHLEVDRLAWTYLLTGSRMALDEFFLLVEAQREYPHTKGNVSDAPRTWGWCLRAVAWAYYIRKHVAATYAPYLSGYTDLVRNLISGHAKGLSYPQPFFLFKMIADPKHLYPTQEQIELYMTSYLMLDVPTESETYVSRTAAIEAAKALPDTDKNKAYKIKLAADALVTYLIDYIGEQRGATQKQFILDLFSYVPIDQIAICLCSLLHAMKAVEDIVLWSALRDTFKVTLLYMVERGVNKSAGGTFYNDVGAYFPQLTVGGTSKEGTSIWKAGAVCYALVAASGLVSDADKIRLYQYAAAVLEGNQYNAPGDTHQMFYKWGWCWPRAKEIGMSLLTVPKQGGPSLLPPAASN